MFFSERICSIDTADKVLEVGPGGTPYHRSDVLLEKKFNDEEAEAQRGYTKGLETDKQVVFYDGGKFPFANNEFDYVICSHVLEHIPEEDFDFFVNELERVARRGYIEYPTFYYEYLYNFNQHVTIPFYRDNTIYYMSKKSTGLSDLKNVHHFFYNTLCKGHGSLIPQLEKYFFQGFEWEGTIKTEKVKQLDKILYTKEEMVGIPKFIKPVSRFKSLRCAIKTLFKKS